MGRHLRFADAPPMYRALVAVLRPLVLTTLRPTIEGLDNIPRRGPAILCANHLSMLDPVIVPLLVPRPVVYLAKREYFRFPPMRWLFDSVGAVPVDRRGGSAARASLVRGTQVLRDGGLLSLFPEGTRSPDGRLYKGKTGPVRLALRSGAVIVPVGLAGTRQIMPPHARWPRLGASVTVRFGAPLRVSGSEEDPATVRAATDRMMRAIRALTGQTYVDVYAPHVAGARADGAGSGPPGESDEHED